ncbi:MAG TPA: hypothetical protein PLW93_00815 [Candidatus Absconditabacterales bacterium]|nr:hypothetical protein [Candidatus Absconditabacterales bacterium]
MKQLYLHLYEQELTTEKVPQSFDLEYKKALQQLLHECQGKNDQVSKDLIAMCQVELKRFYDEVQKPPLFEPLPKKRSDNNRRTIEQKNETNVIQLKTSSTYRIDFDYAMKGVKDFNSAVFDTWNQLIDTYSTIGEESRNLIKSLIVSEIGMSKNSLWSRENMERNYIFDEVRWNTIAHWTGGPWSPLTGVGVFAGNMTKKLVEWKQKFWNNKQEYDNATGPLQIKGITFTTLVCRQPELKQRVLQLLDEDHTVSSHPANQLIKNHLNSKQYRTVYDQVSAIINDPGCINIIQRLTFNPELAIKVTYQDLKDNYAIREAYGGNTSKPEDIRLTAGLSHNLGPSKTYRAIAQQNLYLLAQSVGVNNHISQKHYMIDGELNTQTQQLFSIVKQQLVHRGVSTWNNLTLNSLCTNPSMIKSILTNTEKELSTKNVSYHFMPLLSVSSLQPLQKNGSVHLKYIYHYLKAHKEIVA